jgi:hypothetical protein
MIWVWERKEAYSLMVLLQLHRLYCIEFAGTIVHGGLGFVCQMDCLISFTDIVLTA